MTNMQTLTDKMAIGISLLCAIHCLAFPLMMVLLPSLAVLQFDDEAFHFWMVMVVIPTSAYALTMGCKKHEHYRVAVLGIVGLLLLTSAAFLGAALLGELWEKVLTVTGASIVALGHYSNYRLCRQHDSCACHEHCTDKPIA